MHLRSLLLALVLIAAAPASAQELLGPDGRTVAALAGDDPALENGARYDLWRFRARAGHLYQVTVFADFKAHVAVGAGVVPECVAECVEEAGRPLGDSTLTDVNFFPEASGTYLVRVGGMDGGQTGGYELYLEDLGEQSKEEWESIQHLPVVEDTAWSDVDGADSAAPPPVVRAGVDVEGTLDPFRRNEHGERYGEWEYHGTAGHSLRITLVARDFDEALRVRLWDGSAWQELAYDDDGGTATGSSSALTVTFPETGSYRIQAVSEQCWETCRYVIRAYDLGDANPKHQIGPAAPAAAIAAPADTVQHPAERIWAVGPVWGNLHEADRQSAVGNAYFDLLQYNARAGETVTVRMTSEDFDTELRVGRLRDGLWEELARDDDGGGGTDSQLTLTFPEDGEYEIQARAVWVGDLGWYRISVEPR